MKNGFLKYQLADRVNEALALIGFHKPTAVQEEVIPLMLSKRNVVVEAATGTGKTAAYGLSLLSRIDYIKRSTQVLVLVPSRELALQVETALRSFTTHEKFRVASVYGGMSLTESEKKIKSSPHVLVAVPGRLKDALRGGKLDHFWRDIKFLVIDEADKLLEFGFQEIIDNLVSHVRNMVQVALFSATISEDVEALIRDRFHPLQVVRLGPEEALRNIFFHYVVVDQGQKQRYLAALIQTQKIKQALIFTPNRDEVYSLANFLRAMGHKAEAYHGLLDQVERTAVMKRFKKKQVNYLVATDLAARGLDVEALPAVINYAFPDELEIYLHRCGRTGRAGKRGAVFNLVASKKEQILVESFHADLQVPIKGYLIEPLSKEDVQHVEYKQVKVHLSKGKRDKINAGDIVGFLVNTTGVPADRIGTIAVYDAYSLVDVPEWAFEVLTSNLDDLKLKGKAVRVGKHSLDDQMRKSEVMRKSQIGVRDKKQLEERIAREEKTKKKAAAPEKPVEAKVSAPSAKGRPAIPKPNSPRSGAAGKKLKANAGEEQVYDAPIKNKPKPTKGAPEPVAKSRPKSGNSKDKPFFKAKFAEGKPEKSAPSKSKFGEGKGKASAKPKAKPSDSGAKTVSKGKPKFATDQVQAASRVKPKSGNSKSTKAGSKPDKAPNHYPKRTRK
jgi:superfamily II DNA/RNA helicase